MEGEEWDGWVARWSDRLTKSSPYIPRAFLDELQELRNAVESSQGQYRLCNHKILYT